MLLTDDVGECCRAVGAIQSHTTRLPTRTDELGVATVNPQHPPSTNGPRMDLSLADVLPSICAGMGFESHNPLDLSVERDVIVLLIDGLGAELLARNTDVAPTLAAHVQRSLMAGFPATTATSLSSLAIGAPCATHGIVGYTFAIPDAGDPRLFNALRWTTDSATGPDARDAFPPEEMQQESSRLEALAAHDVDIHYVVPEYQVRSGLTRASFRAPGTCHAASTIEEVRDGILAVARHDGPRRFAYAYYPNLDATGHLHGPETDEWRTELRAIDAVIADLLADLPASCTLVITGDHGMIHADTAIDLDDNDALRAGVRLIAGEARVRHVYADVGAAADVQSRWAAELGSNALVVSREKAVDEHWFGSTPPTSVIANRIGDVLAVAQDRVVLTRPSIEPLEASLIGHHGAWTKDEQLVPLIVK